MPSSRFALTVAAENDLFEIGVYTRERWGERQCRRYLRQIDGCFHHLSAHPELGKPAEVPGFFRYKTGKHVIFYEVGEGGAVLVVRVLHESMLPALHLG